MIFTREFNTIEQASKYMLALLLSEMQFSVITRDKVINITVTSPSIYEDKECLEALSERIKHDQ